jgi:hypothetical protein
MPFLLSLLVEGVGKCKAGGSLTQHYIECVFHVMISARMQLCDDVVETWMAGVVAALRQQARWRQDLYHRDID